MHVTVTPVTESTFHDGRFAYQMIRSGSLILITASASAARGIISTSVIVPAGGFASVITTGIHVSAAASISRRRSRKEQGAAG